MTVVRLNITIKLRKFIQNDYEDEIARDRVKMGIIKKDLRLHNPVSKAVANEKIIITFFFFQ